MAALRTWLKGVDEVADNNDKAEQTSDSAGGMWKVNSNSQARLAPEPVGKSHPAMVPTMQPC